MSEYKIYKNSKGQFHRKDGPAVTYSDGSQYWYKNDKRHREDGPAVIYPDGSQEWWINGKYHRENGPAIIFPDGEQLWFLNNIEYIEPEFYKELYRIGKITEGELFLHLL